ncbi:ABC transporter ATP-binding protein [Clostridium botulinum]|uniref:ABC transporter ATP-binding protein n=1 Tax=Clostridium botulinum TaxID=1491 RepID=UPI0009B4E4D6|nr:ABC transporter ATP-binding protein [Clostridium botulinum]MBY6932190.1 ABC transporter ATP-binding protein [Clostridium botulinum]NFG21639.1 ABC transporter ATP-binding protein [Clostridium botulinum]NFO82295.1 ABC transporter ATP-binding protein [Clostridium botulinum]
MNNEKKSKKKDYFKTFIICFEIMLKRNKLRTITWIILSIIVSFFPSILIVLNRNIINGIKNITEGQSYKITIILLMLVCIVQIFSGLIDTIKNYLYQIIKNKVDYSLYEKLYNKLTTIPLEKFEDSEYYNVVAMANQAVLMNGLNNIKYIIDIISNAITIFSVIFVLIMIHWSLPIALILSMVPGCIGILIAKSMDYNNSLSLMSTKRMESYISSLFFNKNVLKEIRIFKTKNYLIDKWRKVFTYVRNSKIEILLKESKIGLIGSSIIQISTVLVSIYLINNIYNYNITLGDYVALTGAMSTLQSSMGDIAMNIGELFEIALYNTSLFKIINDNIENPTNSSDVLEIATDANDLDKIQTLELKNISFRYPNSNKKVLDNISLKINKGQKIAIVGYNGSGKSTLINVLLGNYTDIDGLYEINGEKINTSSISRYQSKMTVILQDFIHYKLSVRENIGFGDIEYIKNDKFIKNKLKEVGMKDEIDKLSNGIDTILSKEFVDGTELSGGQWQKMAIARSMSKDSEIIIFDEPTSALDPIAELEVFKLLNNVSKDKTTIMISHRLGVAKFADTIIVMKDGKIIENGAHEELIKNDGEYKNMYEAQANYYR